MKTQVVAMISESHEEQLREEIPELFSNESVKYFIIKDKILNAILENSSDDRSETSEKTK
jgi:hypothetical protein